MIHFGVKCKIWKGFQVERTTKTRRARTVEQRQQHHTRMKMCWGERKLHSKKKNWNRSVILSCQFANKKHLFYRPCRPTGPSRRVVRPWCRQATLDLARPVDRTCRLHNTCTNGFSTIPSFSCFFIFSPLPNFIQHPPIAPQRLLSVLQGQLKQYQRLLGWGSHPLLEVIYTITSCCFDHQWINIFIKTLI